MSAFPRDGRHRVRRAHVADEVFDRLAQMVMTGELEPGSTLPPERELAESFDVSRLIVRQAVHRLAEIGLLEVRQGGSTVVGDPLRSDHPSVSALALRYGPSREAMLASLRERQVVGSLGMLVLAARRCDDDDLERLRAIVDAFEDALEKAEARGTPAPHIDLLNERFWICVADITKNPFLQRDTRYWFRVVREDPSITKRHGTKPAERLPGYRAVIGQLAAGIGAAEAYLSVVQSLLDSLEGERRPR